MAKAPKEKDENIEGNKEKALQMALAQIEKAFGKNTIMNLGDESIKVDVETISTGSLGLDIALGIGGLPKGVSLKFSGLKARAKPRSPYKRLPNAKNKAENVRSLTQNMP